MIAGVAGGGAAAATAELSSAAVNISSVVCRTECTECTAVPGRQVAVRASHSCTPYTCTVCGRVSQAAAMEGGGYPGYHGPPGYPGPIQPDPRTVILPRRPSEGGEGEGYRGQQHHLAWLQEQEDRLLSSPHKEAQQQQQFYRAGVGREGGDCGVGAPHYPPPGPHQHHMPPPRLRKLSEPPRVPGKLAAQ